jgi:hypothetical protein
LYVTDLTEREIKETAQMVRGYPLCRIGIAARGDRDRYVADSMNWFRDATQTELTTVAELADRSYGAWQW